MDRSQGELLRQAVGTDEGAAHDAIRELLVQEIRTTSDNLLEILAIAPSGAELAIAVRCGEREIQVTLSLQACREALVVGDRLKTLLAEQLVVHLLDEAGEGPNITGSLPAPAAGTVMGRAGELVKAISEGQSVVALGHSGSGKSHAARLATALVQDHLRLPTLWVDFADPSQGPVGVMSALLDAQNDVRLDGGIVVLDDVQSSPRRAEQCIRLLSALEREGARPRAFRVVAIGWPSTRELLGAALPHATRVDCRGDDVISQLFASIGPLVDQPDAQQELRRLANGDVLVAKVAADSWASSGRVPSLHEVAVAAVNEVGDVSTLTADEAMLVHWVASLGMFEIDAGLDAVTRRAASASVVQGLVDRRWLRLNNDYVSVGHRTFASMLVRVLGESVGSSTAMTPAMASVEYLRGVGDEQIRATLDRLDLASHAQSSEDQHGTVFLARGWTAVRSMSSYLARRAARDVTWGDNTASAVFAALSFAELGMRERWAESVDYVRSRWHYEAEALPSNRGAATAERVDFDEIRAAMAEQDARGGHGPGGQSAAEVDLDRFHRTWAFGLLLLLEGRSAREQRDSANVDVLASASAAAQLPSGAFYPERVPWVTARVVLGLRELGLAYESSEVVRAACDWLREAPPDGPCEFGVWQSGTGVWNTDVMTTAMSVLALVRSGVAPTDTTVEMGVAYLLAQRAQWSQPGNEIDGALALEAILATGGGWRDVGSELSALLTWARDSRSWLDAGVLASDSHTESSKIPFIVGSLVDIIWSIVRDELPLLFEGLGSENLSSARRQVVRPNDLVSVRVTAERLLELARRAVDERERVVERGQAGGEVQRRLQEARERVVRLQTVVQELQSPEPVSEDVVGAWVTLLNEVGPYLQAGSWAPIEEYT